MTLTGKIALVTGAGRGIGRAVALELARQGATIGLVSRTASELTDLVREIEGDGGIASAFPADVGSATDVGVLIRTIESQLGPIDILVNNAGIRGPIAFVQNVAAEDFHQVFQVNVFGTFHTIQAVLPGMIERRWGRILNMSGGGAWTGIRGGIAYGSSKSAVEGLTRTIAQEVHRFGITCNAIQPGRVETKSFPVADTVAGRKGETTTVSPTYAAQCIAWLCSDESADVNGETIDAVAWAKTH
jgi:3-oxoacyl-[acyl-carrier protein] reductase